MDSELKETIHKKLKEIRKIIYEQNENINKDIEIIKEKQRNSAAEKYNLNLKTH